MILPRRISILAIAGTLLAAPVASVSAQSVAASPSVEPATASPAASAGAAACPSPATSPGASAAPIASTAPTASAAPMMSPAASVPASVGSSGAPGADAGGDPCAPAVVLTIETTQSESLSFSKDTLTAPAGTLVRVEYRNDSNVPHNIAFFQGPDANAPRIAGTDVETGPDNLQVVEFTAPTEPGSYFFHCDVHPTLMTGTFEVTPAA